MRLLDKHVPVNDRRDELALMTLVGDMLGLDEIDRLAASAYVRTRKSAADAGHLRHAALSLWLNAGVQATDAAERAGNSVDVLLKVYAKCLDGQEATINRRIEAALGEAA
jgi:hypothetical protein